jgi:hypothetical protein
MDFVGGGKVKCGGLAFPQRLKPDLFCATYGATEVAPFQNGLVTH